MPLIATGFTRLRKLHPRLSLIIIPAGTDELFRLLDRNEVDLVCTLDSHIYDNTYVIADEERIGVHFIAAANHPLAAKETVSIHEVLQQPLLLTEKGRAAAQQVEKLIDKWVGFGGEGLSEEDRAAFYRVLEHISGNLRDTMDQKQGKE